MLCIVYISKAKLDPAKATIPDFLPAILSVARQRNRQADITSALVFREGMFLQLLEGKARDVDDLYRNISMDDRHEQVEKIIDMPVPNRTFSDSDIQLMLNIQEDARLVNFIAVNKDVFLSYGNSIAQKLKSFGCDDLESLKPLAPEYDADFYVNKSFMLKEIVELDWFEIGMLDPEIAIAGILLSERLFRNKYSYKELLESGTFGSAFRLVELLNTLNATGNLLIVETPQVQRIQQPPKELSKEQRKRRKAEQSEGRGTSFGQKVLSWLRKH